MKKKLSVLDFKRFKSEGRKTTTVVAYDYAMAKLIDQSDIESILVGDSVAMIVQGLKGTISVTMDEMVYHTKCVVRGAPNTFIIGDMPFGSYHESVEQAVHNAVYLMKEGGCDCIKLEGGVEMVDTITAIVKAGIPVMGHIGLTPQTASSLGGFKVQGKDYESAKKLINDAKALEDAGVFMIGVECVPEVVGKAITEALQIPTQSIGAGKYCDSFGLLTYDLLGLYGDIRAKFVKMYANLGPVAVDALNNFHKEVTEGTYPSDEYSFHADIPEFK